MPNNPIAISMPRVQRVRRQLTTGAWHYHYYHRPTKVRLPPPDDPTFSKAYEAAERQFAEARCTTRSEEGRPEIAAPSIVPNGRHLRGDTPEPTAHQREQIYYHTPEELVRRWRNRIDIETLANWRSRREGPTYHRFGRAVLYRSDLLTQWEAKNMIVCDPPAEIDREDGLV